MLTANHGAMGLAMKRFSAFSRKLPHPLGLALHRRHLADDLLGEALLGLEDVVLVVAPAELVPAEIEIRWWSSSPPSGLAGGRALPGPATGPSGGFPLSR